MKILFGHILPNAVLPLITILGVLIGWLLGGVAVVEMVFSWPGSGIWPFTPSLCVTIH